MMIPQSANRNSIMMMQQYHVS
uniref:Uncharacterized protein n=1 Tax=Arundo donax TaxID=35708 RepID=A0A0A9BD80_ARUDO